MPLYEATLEQLFFGQQCINRWNFRSDAPPDGVSGAFKLGVAMGFVPDTDIEPFGDGTIAGCLKEIQTNTVTFVSLIVKNIYSVTDFYTYAFPANTVGETSGESLSPINAFGYASNRTRSDIRRAQKRFTGLNEAQVSAGGLLLEAALPTFEALGDAMGDISLAPAGVGTMAFQPVTLGRQKYVVPDSGKDAYRYYPTEAEQLEKVANITAFDLKRQVRSQVSRQYGRGS